RSRGAGLLSQAIPSRSLSSLLGSLGSARSTACASAWLLKAEQLYRSPCPMYRVGSNPPSPDGVGTATAGAAGGDTVVCGHAASDPPSAGCVVSPAHVAGDQRPS